MGHGRRKRAFEETHLYEPKQIAADFPLLLNLISQKRVGDRPDRTNRVPSSAARCPTTSLSDRQRAAREHISPLGRCDSSGTQDNIRLEGASIEGMRMGTARRALDEERAGQWM